MKESESGLENSHSVSISYGYMRNWDKYDLSQNE